jgi:YD repeat-containing protein
MHLFSVMALLCFFTPLSRATETILYGYDAAGRLVSLASFSGQTIEYTYSNGGDLKVVTMVTNAVPPEGASEKVTLKSATSRTTSSRGQLVTKVTGLTHTSVTGLNLSAAPSEMRTISWQAVAGVRYRVQYKNKLDQSTWLDLPGDVVANGPGASKTDTSPNAESRFYRVLIIP